MASIQPTRTRAGELLAGHYTARHFHGRNPATGKQQRSSITICPPGCANACTAETPAKSKAEVQRLVAAWELTLTGSGPVESRTLLDAINARLETAQLATTTMTGYRLRINARIGPVLGSRRLGDITTAELAAYRDYWAARQSPSSVNQDMAIISGGFRYAVENGWLDRSPALGLSRVRAAAPNIAPPVVEDIAAVALHLLSTGRHADRCASVMLGLACATGLRRGEMVTLRWTDVRRNDADRWSLHVERAFDPAKRVKPPKTRQTRVVPLQTETVDAVRRWQQVVAGPWVFPTSRDIERPVYPDTISHAVRRVVREHEDRSTPCEVCGLTKIGRVWLHGGRHYLATALILAGVNPVDAAAILGHAHPSMTLNQYSHANDDSTRAAMDTLAAPARRAARHPDATP